MKEVTLFVRVGRAEKRPVCSSVFSAVLDAQEQRTLTDLINGGNDPARIEFSREDVEGSAAKGKKS